MALAAQQSDHGEARGLPSLSGSIAAPRPRRRPNRNFVRLRARARRGVTDLEPGSGRPDAWILRGRSLERRLWRGLHPFVRRRSVLFTETEQGSWTLHGAWTGDGAEKAARETRCVRVLIIKEDVSRLAYLSFFHTFGAEWRAAGEGCV